MANKRINSKEPLTAAEKQSRYRGKINDEKQLRHDENIQMIRDMLHAMIDKMPEKRLIMFCNKLTQTNRYADGLVDDDQLKRLTGLSDKELAKLVKNGVIAPEEPAELNTQDFLDTVCKYMFDDDRAFLEHA